MFCRIFDPVSWLLIFLSLVSVSLATIIIARLSSLYGVETPDSAKLLFLPLQMLLGEQLENDNWFTKVAIIHKIGKYYRDFLGEEKAENPRW